MRVVLDTNVLLAGIATHGLCEALLAIAFQDHEVVISEHTLSEVAEHYVGKFKASHEQAQLATDLFRAQGELVEPAAVSRDAFTDADDLPVLGTAVAGQVDALITGDKQLLQLGNFGGVPIISPRDFYDRIRDIDSK